MTLFTILILLSGSMILFVPTADAKKASGAYNTTVNSKQVCGDRLCDELKFLSRGPSDQQSKFSVGGVVQQAMTTQSVQSDSKIPSWVKNNAGWWSQGVIDDDEFLQGVQFLIKEGMLDVPIVEQKHTENKEIPEWVKNNAGWWSQGVIDDDEFLQGVQFLIKEGMLAV